MEKSKFKEELKRLEEEEARIDQAVKDRQVFDRENAQELLENGGFIPPEPGDFGYIPTNFESYFNIIAARYGLDEKAAVRLREYYYAELDEIGLTEDDYEIDTPEKMQCFKRALESIRNEDEEKKPQR